MIVKGVKLFLNIAAITALATTCGSRIAAAEDDCAPVEHISSLHSTEQNMSFILEHQICASGFGSGSQEYWVDAKKEEGRNSAIRVFHEFSNTAPAISLEGSDLIIQINEIGIIDVSLASAFNVKIIYHISRLLSSDVYMKEIEDDRSRMKTEIAEGRAVYSGGTIADNLRLLDKSVHQQVEQYEHFNKWVKSSGATVR